MEFSLSDLPNIAKDVLKRAKENASNDHATLITFSGDLGAGKTTMIQEIAKALGIQESLQSPTFVIYKIYEIPSGANSEETSSGKAGNFSRLVHGDMYRLESAEDIKKLGWSELLADPENLICVEWPERIADAIPDWAVKITLKHKADGEMRGIDFSG